MKLSILICSIVGREEQLKDLLAEIELQKNNLKNDLKDIEVLTEVDDKQITTGAKRNKLLHQARGDYIVFIDDDDRISEDYLSEIMNALIQAPDCVGMKGWYSINKGRRIEWRLSKEYTDHDCNGILFRRTNHIAVVKRKYALQAGFPDKSNAEDKWYSERIIFFLKSEIFIDKFLYYYEYSTFNKSYS